MFVVNRIRSVLVVLVAVTSLAVAMGSVMPAAQARPPKPGAHQKSPKAKGKKPDKCGDLHNSFLNLGNIVDTNRDAGNTETADQALDAERGVFDAAKNAGCAWAARVVPPGLPQPQQTGPQPMPTVAR